MRRVGTGKSSAWIRTRLYGSLLLAAITLMLATTPRAFSQIVNPPSNQSASSQGITPTGQYTAGVPVADWMVFPSLYVGAVYDSNRNQTPSAPNPLGLSPDSGTSLRVAPRIIATH